MASHITPRKLDNGFYAIGPEGTSFGRSVVLVNPDEAESASSVRYGRQIHRYILSFGAYGSTNLSVWAYSLDSAVEIAAEYLTEHAPGHIMHDGSDEAQDLVKEECQRQGIDFADFESLDDDRKWEITDAAFVDMTQTESGWLTSYEWGIALEDPSRKDLEAFCYPYGIDWKGYRS